jgi:SAM-dependent methyltransferase
VYTGFPILLLTLLRCLREGGALELEAGTLVHDGHVQRGNLRCHACHALYPVEDGIVKLLDPSALDQESQHERALRDQPSAGDDTSWEQSPWSRMEIEPTLAALRPLSGLIVLELGCGGGRYTVLMADQAAAVMAVDFSHAALKKLGSRVASHWNIGLVQADCTRLGLAGKAFDRILSTLVSNLPSPAHRYAMFRLAADALAPSGRFVFSAHHHTLVSRFRRVPQAGRYHDGGIFCYLFRRRELFEETQKYFRGVQCRPIQISLPFADRLGLPLVALSRTVESIPLVNQLGQLLLVTATEPCETAAHEHT